MNSSRYECGWKSEHQIGGKEQGGEKRHRGDISTILLPLPVGFSSIDDVFLMVNPTHHERIVEESTASRAPFGDQS